MKFTEAFSKLGYHVDVPRQDWSAEKSDGVCISLWQVEMGLDEQKRPWIDTRVHANENALWRTKPGNRKRIRHLQRAIDELGGVVDVVIVHGKPGAGVTDAAPWIPAERKGTRWGISDFDPETGHFTARINV